MPRPMLTEAAAAYALWAPSYPAQAHNPLMRAEERALLSLLPDALAGHSVLDVGCGSGRYLLHALARGARRLSGVDFSAPMLERANLEINSCRSGAEITLLQGDLMALPVADAWADVTLCGLVVGHVDDLQQALRELQRVTRSGGLVLCSDVHPVGHALGWVRDFKCGDQRYAVRHTPHLFSHWHAACAAAGLMIEAILQPMLDPHDIPVDAHFDRRALQIPVALVMKLRCV